MVHNEHRFGGGSDVVAAATVELLRARGHTVNTFWRDSKALSGPAGRWRAFGAGLYAPSALREFAAALERHRPDLAHVHEVYPLISPWIFPLCKRRGVPTALTCHDYRMTCPVCTHLRDGRVCAACGKGGEWRCAVRNCQGNRLQSLAYALRNLVARRFRLYQAVDLLLTPSAFARDWLIQQAGVRPERIRVVGNPVLAPEAPVGAYLPEQRPYIGYVGRFAPEKGVDVLVRAAALAELPLRLAGDHQGYRPPLSSPSIRYEGRLSGVALESFYAGMRLLVMPSVCFETFGLVAAEAMLRGIPVVCSNLGAMAEMVTDGAQGALVPPGDVAALALKLRQLWTATAELSRMSEAARLRARDFLPEHYAAALEEAYRHLPAAPARTDQGGAAG